MAVERRKDSKRRVLKEGEYERPNGTYEFRWRDKQAGEEQCMERRLKICERKKPMF